MSLQCYAVGCWLQGQSESLREEVMNLRLRLEGASAAAEEVTQLRARESKLQQDLKAAQQALSQNEVCSGMLVCE